jgi:hypothetical protein
MAERWPHMMKRATAAAYCDLSESAFVGEVAAGRLPSPVNLGGRDHWFRPALDHSLSIIAGDMAADYEKDFWNRAASA